MDVNTEWNLICRICLQSDGELRSLFDRDEMDMTFSSKVMKCTNIEIIRDENLPEQICSLCVANLNTAYRFRVNCESSDAILQNYREQLVCEKYQVHEEETGRDSPMFEVSHEGILYAYKPPSGLDVKLVTKEAGSMFGENDNDIYIYDEEPDLPHEERDIESDNDTMITFDDTINSRIDEHEDPHIDDTASLDNMVQNSTGFLYTDSSGIIYMGKDDILSNIGIKKESTWDEIQVINVEPPTESEEDPLVNQEDPKIQMKTIQTIRKSKNANEEKPTIETITTKTGADGSTETIIRVKRNLTTAKQMHVCKLCGNSYKYRHALETHMRRHLGDKPFKCETCEKAFVVQFELRRHMRTHTGQKPYGCKYCERKFSDFGSKIKHERTHTGERPYVCTVCEKSFSYSHVLSSHMLTHTGVKRFSCEECGKKFTKSHHLKAHLNTHLKAATKLQTTNSKKPTPSTENDSFNEMLSINDYIISKSEPMDMIDCDCVDEENNEPSLLNVVTVLTSNHPGDLDGHEYQGIQIMNG